MSVLSLGEGSLWDSAELAPTQTRQVEPEHLRGFELTVAMPSDSEENMTAAWHAVCLSLALRSGRMNDRNGATLLTFLSGNCLLCLFTIRFYKQSLTARRRQQGRRDARRAPPSRTYVEAL